MKSFVDIFAELGARMVNIPTSVIEQAERENEWFCQIPTAMDAICSQMLDRNKLELWISGYNIIPHRAKRVAIVMAGNIPAVGFADLLYTIASGNIPVVKYSSKDRVLMQYIVKQLLDIEPQLEIETFEQSSVIDAVIATGSDSAALHFRSLFGDIPSLIRGSRHSVAVLSGQESLEEIKSLSRDIFTYSGLGCRNVSLIFAPQGFDFELYIPTLPKGFTNNYRHTKALRTMQSLPFTDCNGALVVEGEPEFPRHISQINICRYNNIEQVKEWLAEHDSRIQCVVSSINVHPRTVALGQAQYPTLNDYADNVDVMKFLLSL